MAACTATSLGLREVGGVAMDAEEDVTGCVADGSVRVGGGIVEEFGNGFCCGFGSFGLRCSKGAECHGHSWIDGTGVVEERANNLLYSGFGFGGECSCVVRWLRQLEFYSILFFNGSMWGVFGFDGGWMGEAS